MVGKYLFVVRRYGVDALSEWLQQFEHCLFDAFGTRVGDFGEPRQPRLAPR